MGNEKLFTEKGRESLINYTSTLVELYFKQQEYPFKQRIVGIDVPNHSLNIKSKIELEFRIKQMYSILGLLGMKCELDNGSMIELRFECDKDGC